MELKIYKAPGLYRDETPELSSEIVGVCEVVLAVDAQQAVERLECDLETQRAATYQAVEREHAARKQATQLRESRQCAETYMSIIADKLQFSSSQFPQLSSGWCEELVNTITALQSQLAVAQAQVLEAQDGVNALLEASSDRCRKHEQQVAQLRENAEAATKIYTRLLQSMTDWMARLKPDHHPMYRRGVEEVIASAFNGVNLDSSPVLMSDWQKQQVQFAQLHTAHTTLRGLVEAFAKTTKGKVTINRYEHGGGRMFVDNGKNRDLIADTYNEGDREFIALCYEVFSKQAALTATSQEGQG